MLGSQLLKLIFVVNGEHPELTIIHKPIVENPQAAPSSLSTARISPAQLTEATRSRHYIARKRIALKVVLQCSIFVVRQIAANALVNIVVSKKIVRIAKL